MKPAFLTSEKVAGLELCGRWVFTLLCTYELEVEYLGLTMLAAAANVDYMVAVVEGY